MLPLANGPQWELNVVDPSEGEDIHFCFCFFLFFFFSSRNLGVKYRACEEILPSRCKSILRLFVSFANILDRDREAASLD